MEFFCNTNQSTKQLTDTISFMKAISEENRLKIICFLNSGEKPVCKISKFLNLPQNLISHHLKVLKENGMVKSRKEGLRIFYYLDNKNINKVINFLNLLMVEKKDGCANK